MQLIKIIQMFFFFLVYYIIATAGNIYIWLFIVFGIDYCPKQPNYNVQIKCAYQTTMTYNQTCPYN